MYRFSRRTRLFLRSMGSILSALAIFSLFVYPLFVTLWVAFDQGLRKGDLPGYLPGWYQRTAKRYAGWAEEYLASKVAASVHHNNIPATEWPMFGSVFFLLGTDALINEWEKETVLSPQVEKAVEKAVHLVNHPVTATWVQTKWGDDYLEEENCFYRGLLILGISSFQRITGSQEYEDKLYQQANGLAREIREAPYHLIDDYPGECYPNDVLWTLACILSLKDRLEEDVEGLGQDFMSVLTEKTVTELGLPPYGADKDSGFPWGGARGCSNSGILCYAPDLDQEIASRWYDLHEKFFWKQNGFASGFTEFPGGKPAFYWDPDAGPVLFGWGVAATAFGMGAARRQGRFDHYAPMVMEVIASSWPTPFGHLIPSFLGYAADAPVLGEVSMIFSMTRPKKEGMARAYAGGIPGSVWLSAFLYFLAALLSILWEVLTWRRVLSLRRATSPQTASQEPADSSHRDGQQRRDENIEA